MTDHTLPPVTTGDPRSTLTHREAVDTLVMLPLVTGHPSTAEVLGMSPKTARRRYHAGEIPVIKYGSRLMVPTAWIRQQLAIDNDGSDAA